jgi:hypothetical protein
MASLLPKKKGAPCGAPYINIYTYVLSETTSPMIEITNPMIETTKDKSNLPSTFAVNFSMAIALR